MKLQYKHQAFQRDAAQAVVEVFGGQPLQDAFSYSMDVGRGKLALETMGFRNQSLLLNDDALTANIRHIQRQQDLALVETVQRDANGTLALSIEMETGTGKTYTYIKTMYELHKHYGWTKFIIVVPSVAIREGVVKSLHTMADHFAEEYGQRMQHFVYDSARLTAIEQFASDAHLHVMVINTQAFNATGTDARRIKMKLEDFAWRRPIDVIAATHPILIIDEPQSVLGADKKNKMVDSKVKRGETAANDSDAYQLIMRDKERLLSLSEPTRFIFSHSALKEGWDNPNVFQICTLKQSDSEVKKRQEVGRGMRLCVNQQGERQDNDLLGEGVYDTNVLTVVASESYKDFSEALQKELAESVTSRPVLVTQGLFEGKTIVKANGEKQTLSAQQAAEIWEELVSASYVKKQKLTDKYFDDKQAGTLQLEDWQDDLAAIVKILDKVFNPEKLKAEDGRGKTTAQFKKERFAKKEFQELWKRINQKTYYEVDFESQDLIKKSIIGLNHSLHVTRMRIAITTGALTDIRSKEELEAGKAMDVGNTQSITVKEAVASGVRYDLVGELVQRTGLKRSSIVEILGGIKAETFGMFRINPEEFIIRAGNIINEQKAMAVIKQIVYHKTDQCYEENVFAEQELRGRIGKDAIKSEKSLYDLVVVDSQGVEKSFAEELERQDVVEVYTKLPRGFYINTPVGKYNPDWAIVFREGDVKHIYFVAETKGSESITQLRGVELAKIECASRHFTSISDKKVKFDVVTDYDKLYNKVMQDE
jgi:hypothetical protein